MNSEAFLNFTFPKPLIHQMFPHQQLLVTATCDPQVLNQGDKPKIFCRGSCLELFFFLLKIREFAVEIGGRVLILIFILVFLVI